MKSPSFEYWAVTAPGDEHPEMIFRDQEWARSAVAGLLAELPQALGTVRIFRVVVTYEERP